MVQGSGEEPGYVHLGLGAVLALGVGHEQLTSGEKSRDPGT